LELEQPIQAAEQEFEQLIREAEQVLVLLAQVAVLESEQT